jgi:nickel/cobalt transporter (NiCoT) family protein
LNENLGAFGFLVIALFVLSWIVSTLIYRWNRFGELVPGSAETT